MTVQGDVHREAPHEGRFFARLQHSSSMRDNEPDEIRLRVVAGRMGDALGGFGLKTAIQQERPGRPDLSHLLPTHLGPIISRHSLPQRRQWKSSAVRGRLIDAAIILCMFSSLVVDGERREARLASTTWKALPPRIGPEVNASWPAACTAAPGVRGARA